ncbi:hypothetical protein PHYNN_12 [Pantoea phage Phynn]|nr:hypothetical protein PHYNN_12 [Pantoea phage Phynn]
MPFLLARINRIKEMRYMYKIAV